MIKSSTTWQLFIQNRRKKVRSNFKIYFRRFSLVFFQLYLTSANGISVRFVKFCHRYALLADPTHYIKHNIPLTDWIIFTRANNICCLLRQWFVIPIFFHLKAGSTLVHSWHTGNEEFTVSWEDVFISQYPLFYEVTVGTVEGGSDILQWQETKLTSVKFRLPPTIKKSSVVSLHVNVRAISSGGTFEDIKFVIIHW